VGSAIKALLSLFDFPQPPIPAGLQLVIVPLQSRGTALQATPTAGLPLKARGWAAGALRAPTASDRVSPPWTWTTTTTTTTASQPPPHQPNQPRRSRSSSLWIFCRTPRVDDWIRGRGGQHLGYHLQLCCRLPASLAASLFLSTLF